MDSGLNRQWPGSKIDVCVLLLSFFVVFMFPSCRICYLQQISQGKLKVSLEYLFQTSTKWFISVSGLEKQFKTGRGCTSLCSLLSCVWFFSDRSIGKSLWCWPTSAPASSKICATVTVVILYIATGLQIKMPSGYCWQILDCETGSFLAHLVTSLGTTIHFSVNRRILLHCPSWCHVQCLNLIVER